MLVDLAVATLVDQFTNALLRGVSIGDVGLYDFEHLAGRLGQLDEDTIVDLEKTEELEGLALLGVDLVDTGPLISEPGDARYVQKTYPLIRIAKTNLGSAAT